MENQNDLELAERICDELRNNNLFGIVELNELYGAFFIKYIDIKLRGMLSGDHHFQYSSESLTHDILQNFWIEKIIDKRVICDFKSKNNASLKTFLSRILYFHTINECRNLIKRKEVPLSVTGREENEKTSPFDDIEKFEQERLLGEIVNTALERLSIIRPEDAQIVRLKMEGKSYEEIAVNFGNDPENEDKFKRKVNAIKKQCTRTGTGSFARFKIIVNRLLAEKNNKLSFDDEGISLLSAVDKKEALN